MNIDRDLLLFLNSFTGRLPWFDSLFVFLAEGIVFFVAVGVFFFLFDKRKRKETGFMIVTGYLAAFFGRGVFTPLIRSVFFRERPFVNEVINVLVQKDPSEGSFPSGHTVVMFAIALAVYSYNKKLGIAFFVASLLSAIARVIVGVHYPLDILGGIVIGFISFIMAKNVLDILVRKP